MNTFDKAAFDVLVPEGMLPTREIAKQIGAKPRALARWASDGVTLSNGQTIRLEHVRFPGRIMSSVPAVRRFLERCVAVVDANRPVTLNVNRPELATA